MEEYIIRMYKTGWVYYGKDTKGIPRFGNDIGLAVRYPGNTKEAGEVIKELLLTTKDCYYAQRITKAKEEMAGLN